LFPVYKDNHLKKKKEQENPEVRKIHKYLSQDIVLSVLADEFGVKPEKIFTTPGISNKLP